MTVIGLHKGASCNVNHLDYKENLCILRSRLRCLSVQLWSFIFDHTIKFYPIHSVSM